MLDIAKHKIILVGLLKDIYGDIAIAPSLGFKGGTAAYLFYNLPRFSVDLDFNLLNNTDEIKIKEKIENIAERYGAIQESKIKRFTIFVLLSYEKGERKIKIEIFKRNTGDKYMMRNYLGIPMLVMAEEDMAANKLFALLDRKEIANRDIFDIWYFLKNGWSINEEIIKSRTGLNLKEYIRICIEKIEKVNSKKILEGLGDLLLEKQKDWARVNLKKDVLFWLNFYAEKR